MFIRHSQNETDCAGNSRRPGSFPPNPSPTNGSPILNSMTIPSNSFSRPQATFRRASVNCVKSCLVRQVRWLGLCPKIKIERAWDTNLNPQQEYALWVAARRDIGGRFGLFILSSRSRIGDQFWRWEEKHEETFFPFFTLALAFVAGAALSAQVRDWHDLEECHKQVQEAIQEMEHARAANHYDMAGHGAKAEGHLAQRNRS